MVIGFTLATLFVLLTGLLVVGLCKAAASGDRAAGYIHAERLQQGHSPESRTEVIGVSRSDVNDAV